MRRLAWLGLFWGMIGFACGDDGDDDVTQGDAALDGGADARTGDGSLDARSGDASMDATVDAQPDAQPDGSRVLNCSVQDFIEAHQACNSDDECAIVGSCSGGFGFEAVNVAAKDEGQRLSDQTPRECAAYDGPLYHAVCEQGRCQKRATGHACGEAPDLDGGTHPDRCPADQERYDLLLPDAASRTTGCYRRCSGPSDTRCGAGQTCQETDVCSVNAGPGTTCGPITIGLCWP